MAKVPIARLKRDEIIRLYERRCKHGHRYMEHYGCFLEETKSEVRVGYFDIETSNLKADFGIVFHYSILDELTGEIVRRTITPAELKDNLDKEVIQQVIADIRKFDVLVTYYGTKFDLPFVRTRALYWGLEFPGFGEIQHKDAYYIAKSKLNLSRRSLENVSRLMFGKTEKNHIASLYWIKALGGHKKALEYIADHCDRDVRELQRVYKKLIRFVKNGTKSI